MRGIAFVVGWWLSSAAAADIGALVILVNVAGRGLAFETVRPLHEFHAGASPMLGSSLLRLAF